MSSNMKHVTLGVLTALVTVAIALRATEATAGNGNPSQSRQSQSLSLNEMTTMEIVRQVAREQPQVAARIIREITSKAYGRHGEVYERLIIKELETPTEGDNCNLCNVLIRVLNAWSRVVGYPEVESTVIEFCELLLTALDESYNSKVICPGAVKLQGPHVFSVIRRTTPEEVCETLNSCYSKSPIQPDWPARPSVSAEAVQPAAAKDGRVKSGSTRRSATGRAGTIKIAQLTDVHVELDYLEDTSNDCGLYVCCQSGLTDNSNAGYWGDYNCNVPPRTVQLFLDKIEQDIQPDHIIFSGDVPPHTVWEETLSSQYQCTETLVQMMTATFTNKRVLPCIGNHEMYPTNLFSTLNLREETVPLLIKFANLWKDIAQFDQENMETFQRAGYYTTLLQGNLRVVTIMTNYMYSTNFYNAINHKPPTENSLNDGEAIPIKEEVANLFARAREAGEKVIVLGHHVVGNSDYIVREAKWFESLTTNYSDIIVLQLAGHTHTDEFRLLNGDDGSTIKSMVYVSPSIDLSGTRNPSVRVYELDDTTWELLDYTQYYFDLKSIDKDDTNPPVITELYSARNEYGLADLRPESWFDLLNRFMNDEALILKHINNEHARADPPATTCDADCRLRHVCRQRYASYDRYVQCLELFDPITTTTIGTTTTRPTLPVLTNFPFRR